MPRVDVSEKKDSYVLEMELPGYTENYVELDLKDRVLTISSKLKDAKKAEKEEKKEAAESVYLKRQKNTPGTKSLAPRVHPYHPALRRFCYATEIMIRFVCASALRGITTVKSPFLNAAVTFS